MLTSEFTTPRGERDADAERPPEFAPSTPYARLRAVCDTAEQLTPEARATIRGMLEEPLRNHRRSLGLALDALDGPDPETALLYLFDSIATMRRVLTALDCRITGSTLALVASIAPFVS